jgi:hypothetical protein
VENKGLGLVALECGRPWKDGSTEQGLNTYRFTTSSRRSSLLIRLVFLIYGGWDRAVGH